MSNAPARTLCARCNAELTSDAAYCPACGRKVKGYTVREAIGLCLFAFLVLGFYGMIVQAAEDRMRVHPGEIAATLIGTGLLVRGIARKRRVLFFFLGCLFAVPLMFLAAILGGAFRTP